MSAAEMLPDSGIRSWNESNSYYAMYGITETVALDKGAYRFTEYYSLVAMLDALCIFHSGTGYVDCPKNWVLI